MIPKIMYFYWGGVKLSYLRYLTIYSFCKLNPTWEVILYIPKNLHTGITWNSGEQSSQYEGMDYFDEVYKLNVTVKKIDFNELIGKSDIPEVHKSDILRYYLIHKYGGMWSDMDILYTKPMNLPLDKTIICKHEYTSIGLIGGKKDSNLFKTLYRLSKDCNDKEYQSYGVKLWRNIPLDDYYNLPMHKIYYYDCENISKIYGKNILSDDSIGIHWYGGDKLSNLWENKLTPNNYLTFDNVLCKSIMSVMNLKGKFKYINKISIVVPCELDRFKLFSTTLAKYINYGLDDDVEFVVVTRTIDKLIIPGVNIKLIKYKMDCEYFNPAKALNIGFRAASHDNIIITCPEVMPICNVIEKFRKMSRCNCICQVFDETKWHNHAKSLVNSEHRCKTPYLYFLAMYKKEDMETINGWDEDYLDGVGYEDTDFGERFNIAMPNNFIVRDDLTAVHQWHDRSHDFTLGAKRNQKLFQQKQMERRYKNG